MTALLVSDDPSLVAAVQRIAARSAAEVSLAPSLLFAGPHWTSARTVLVDARADGPPPSRRNGVVLVGLDLDDPAVWDRATRVGAEHVVFLPDAADWLADLLAGPLPDPDGRVVSVVGGAGGVGASTLAVAVGLVGAEHGPAVLLDLDPWGGGLDVALGLEAADGVRWDAALHGPAPDGRRVIPHATLPRLGELAVLSCPRAAPVRLPLEAVADLLDSLPSRFALTAVDLARSDAGLIATACSRSTTAVVVVPARVRGLAAALAVTDVVRAHVDDVRLVVRAGPDLAPADVERALGVRVGAVIPYDRGLGAREARGEPPGVDVRHPYGRAARALLRPVPGLNAVAA